MRFLSQINRVAGYQRVTAVASVPVVHVCACTYTFSPVLHRPIDNVYCHTLNPVMKHVAACTQVSRRETEEISRRRESCAGLYNDAVRHTHHNINFRDAAECEPPRYYVQFTGRKHAGRIFMVPTKLARDNKS